MRQVRLKHVGPNPVIARGDRVVPLGIDDLRRQRYIEWRLRMRARGFDV